MSLVVGRVVEASCRRVGVTESSESSSRLA
jgi:hypothetical protein